MTSAWLQYFQDKTRKSEAAKSVESLHEAVKRILPSGENVLISGFGKYYGKDEVKRRGRNRGRGEELMPAERWAVTFKCTLIRSSFTAHLPAALPPLSPFGLQRIPI
jgi:nucleoid DNA-binding protein